MNTLLDVALAVLALSMLLILYRLVRGPTGPDRAVAADALSVNVIGAIMVWSMRTGSGSFFEVALVVALLGFVGTVALAKYLAGVNVLD